MNKIRDQGMGIDIFVLRFKICTRGVGFEISATFLCFRKMGLFVRSLHIQFLRDLSLN